VVPGWELASSGATAEESRRITAQIVSAAGLDELEAQLGLGGPSSAPVAADSTAAGEDSAAPVIQSARSSQESGLIPLHWICGIFSGSLPQEQSSVVWDWVLLNNDRFAGVYLTAALLGIFQQVKIRNLLEFLYSESEYLLGAAGHDGVGYQDVDAARRGGLWGLV